MAIRVLSSIQFTSPSGRFFEASWIGDETEITKKVGVFNYPDVDGGSTQDRGIAAQTYPLNFSFAGENHQLDAKNFGVALLERGEWRIVHPTLGYLDLQPVKFKFSHQPVKNKYETAISSTWIRNIPDYNRIGADVYTSANIQRIAFELYPGMFDKKPLRVAKTLELPATKTFLRKSLDVIKNVIAKTYSLNSKIRSEVSQKVDAANKIIDSPAGATTIVLSAIDTILNIPATADAMVTEKVRMYKNIGKRINGILDDELDFEVLTVSEASSNDLIQGSLTGAICASTTVGEVPSRSEALEIADGINEFADENNSLNERMSAALQKKLSVDSYNGNIEGYDAIRNVIGTTVGYVLDYNYSQKVKKTVTIAKPTLTLIYAIENYPDLTEDEAFDYLISTNLLVGDEIMTLPVGKEITVYV